MNQADMFYLAAYAYEPIYSECEDNYPCVVEDNDIEVPLVSVTE